MNVVKEESQHVAVIGIRLMFARIFMSQDTYNKYLYDQTITIDKRAFPAYAEQLIQCLKLTKKKSANFRNADSEAGVIVTGFPTLKPYYNIVYKMVKKHRGKCGLIQ